MTGYPNAPPNYGYGAPPPPYGATPAAAPAYGQQPYGAPSAPYGSPYGAPPPADKPEKDKPPKDSYGAAGGYPTAPGASPYGNPFAALMPSQFLPGTDPNLVTAFQMADQDLSGFIDDKELQKALSADSQSFSMRTVHLLMYLFTNTNTRKIGPKEFIQVFYCLQNWRSIFERFDRDRSGRIDANELREALLSLGFSVSPIVLDLLVSKFDKSGGKNRAIEYDNFIECCLTVKGTDGEVQGEGPHVLGLRDFGLRGLHADCLAFPHCSSLRSLIWFLGSIVDVS